MSKSGSRGETHHSMKARKRAEAEARNAVTPDHLRRKNRAKNFIGK